MSVLFQGLSISASFISEFAYRCIWCERSVRLWELSTNPFPTPSLDRGTLGTEGNSVLEFGFFGLHHEPCEGPIPKAPLPWALQPFPSSCQVPGSQPPPDLVLSKLRSCYIPSFLGPRGAKKVTTHHSLKGPPNPGQTELPELVRTWAGD